MFAIIYTGIPYSGPLIYLLIGMVLILSGIHALFENKPGHGIKLLFNYTMEYLLAFVADSALHELVISIGSFINRRTPNLISNIAIFLPDVFDSSTVLLLVTVASRLVIPFQQLMVRRAFIGLFIDVIGVNGRNHPVNHSVDITALTVDKYIEV